MNRLLTSMISVRSASLYAFCNATRQWAPLSSLEPLATVDSQAASVGRPSLELAHDDFTVLTYNVFSGPGSENLPHASHRTKTILSILKHSKADVIALQEINTNLERTLRRERWLRDHWAITSLQDYFLSSTHGESLTQNATNGSDGCLLGIRKQLMNGEAGTDGQMLRLAGSQGKVLVSLQTGSGVCAVEKSMGSKGLKSKADPSRHKPFRIIVDERPNSNEPI